MNQNRRKVRKQMMTLDDYKNFVLAGAVSLAFPLVLSLIGFIIREIKRRIKKHINKENGDGMEW